LGETIAGTEQKRIKYAMRKDEFETIESLSKCVQLPKHFCLTLSFKLYKVNDGMDDIYESEEEEDNSKKIIKDIELEAIVGEAINPSKYSRYYFDHRGMPQVKHT
jgi:hypothetical protein